MAFSLNTQKGAGNPNFSPLFLYMPLWGENTPGFFTICSVVHGGAISVTNGHDDQ
jgi:hypothetical protein